MQSNNLIQVLESSAYKEFILKHLDDNPSALALSYSRSRYPALAEVLQLIDIYQRSKRKLPELTALLPALTKKMYEQSSSEQVASFKATLIGGEVLIDLTAGLGVDSMAFAKRFGKVIAIDPDPLVHQYLSYNLKKAGIMNVNCIRARAEEFDIPACDWIYLDPDRRPGGSRVISLDSMSPDLRILIPKAMAISGKIMVKLSPLFDIKEAMRAFKELSNLYVISEKNEVKEVLILLEKGYISGPKIHAVDLGKELFHFESTQISSIDFPEPPNESPFLLLPVNALKKAELDASYLKDYKVFKHHEFNYYFSFIHYLAPGFITYRILASGTGSTKAILSQLSMHGNSFTLVLKGKGDKNKVLKKLRLKEGSEDLLLILNGRHRKHYLLKRL